MTARSVGCRADRGPGRRAEAPGPCRRAGDRAGGGCAGRPAAGAQAAGACEPGASPYEGVAGAQLEPAVHTSKDDTPVRYVVWAGTVPSFDGLPLSVDVTVPCDGDDGPRPTIAILHGFTDDKHIWEETGKSDTVMSEGRPGSNSRWNDIWFASRGYAVLTYTARGWHDSCGPDTAKANGGTMPAACAEREHWIHLDDARWEVRDAQWLVAGLVDGKVADPDRLAITGGSYGGAATASAAMLADQQMCGADPVPAELGEDPCAGRGDGDLAPWTAGDGTPLTWAAAVPMYTFADLMGVLAPNGRWADGTDPDVAGGSSTDPVGVPLSSTLSALSAGGQVFGTFAPKGSDLSSDLQTTVGRLLEGDPYPQDEPLVQEGLDAYQRFKSPIAIEPQGDVPIFWVQGTTDSLFPATQALAMREHVDGRTPGAYPMKVFLGDIGHDVAAERQDDWDLVKAQMNDFVDHFLRPDRTPEAPTYDVGVSTTRCLDPEADQTYRAADEWSELVGDPVTFSSQMRKTTSTREPGPSGAASDPISTATLPGPDSYKGCRIVRPAAVDPTTATYDFEVEDAIDVLGSPTIRVEGTASGSDVQLAVRLWDLTADGDAQALVARGVWRAGAGEDLATARFQLPPTAYRLAKGHTLRVEVTGNDRPYLLANNQQSDITVDRLRVDLPEPRTATDRTEPAGPSAPKPGVVLLLLVLVAVLIVGGAIYLVVALRDEARALRRRRGRERTGGAD